jgi:ABC-2 type transport system permease protein
VLSDVLTVIWKELHELLFAAGNRRGSWTSVAIMVGIAGLLFPLQTGREWFTSWFAVYTACFPIMTVVNLVADSFAGERERHTLETLLASRLPDRAIVLGKVLAAAGYGWGLVLLSQPVAVIALNVADWQGHVSFFRPEIFAAVVTFGLLLSLLFAAMGVLVSMTAATVRQAGQRMLIPFLAIYALPGLLPLVLPRLPAEWLARVETLDAVQAVLVLVLVLVLADGALCSAALLRFRRAVLALD